MINRPTDLMNIGISGLNASTALLTTTGNNISNVNSEGYTRQRTSFTSSEYGGVGQGETDRIINTFVQNQLRRDTTSFSEAEIYYDNISVLDNILASEANSLATGFSNFFEAVNDAANDPANLSTRNLVLGQAKAMTSQITVLSDYLERAEDDTNDKMEGLINDANYLVESISDLNKAIKIAGTGTESSVSDLKDHRDQAILELSKIMSIETRDGVQGEVLVNLSSGESLVLEDGSFNMFQLNGDPDPDFKKIELVSGTGPTVNATVMSIDEDALGGQLGGLTDYRNDVLAPTQRELGKIAMAFAESINTVNRLGMDFDGQLGSNIFTLPEVQALNYDDNSDPALVVNGRVEEGRAAELTSADYQIEIDAVTAGTPDTVDFTVTLLNPDGTIIYDSDGNAMTQSYTGVDAASDTFTSILGGIELEFPDGANYAVGDKFLLQPTKNTGDDITLATNRAEDLALASPIIAQVDTDNLGDAVVSATTVTNTVVDTTFADSEASAFDGAGALQVAPNGPGGVYGAPSQIVFTSGTDYEVQDDAGNVIATVTGATDFENVLAQAKSSGTWPAAFSALDDYPGYDISLEGSPKAGDIFTIAFNTDGFSDNSNALNMANLQDEGTVLLNNTGGDETLSFHEAYSFIVGDIGEQTASADVTKQATEAMYNQSKDAFDSVSGVNLDEEAANLVRYQQSYAAAAKIFSAAQDMFNTILQIG